MAVIRLGLGVDKPMTKDAEAWLSTDLEGRFTPNYVRIPMKGRTSGEAFAELVFPRPTAGVYVTIPEAGIYNAAYSRRLE